MRIPLICGNWKMFKTVHETVLHLKELRGLVKGVQAADIVVAPPFTSVAAAAEVARGSNVGVAAQNLHWEREGAFTGEVSAGMLRDAGAAYVIIGHSERRTLFGETDLTVNRKILAAIGAELTAIVCVGETLPQREADQTLAVLDQQLKQGCEGLTAEQFQRVILAYEPVWAIGTGRNATPQQAQDAHAHLRLRVRQWFGADTADRTRILYGGSMKPDNVAAIMAGADVDGGLVGGASLDPRGFADMVRQAGAAKGTK